MCYRPVFQRLDSLTAAVLSAMQSMLRIAGPDVSPFNTAKQSVLIYALASIMTTVTAKQIGIILVNAATSPSRRRLLADFQLVRPRNSMHSDGRIVACR